MDDGKKAQVIQKLLEIILCTMPDARIIDKYGGKIVERISGEPESQCCGYFVYAKHISLEFTLGAQLTDPSGILEGEGKHRRHVKLKNTQDLAVKQCKAFLEQVSNL